ncbi:hypothetical protein J2Z35_001225 [Acetoanaerobium pronyense]|uniref:Uncharacterized protein n=1 Tax=Acetoanaerobium pronyense TaxID=1482736 RepID=A0ABS4KI25_9FIRM|nr:hypothetical protein [Acetoanaerobium pronyense]MBP2027431.1 hypothetical protein [Acetoanaerobium pronyense]
MYENIIDWVKLSENIGLIFGEDAGIIFAVFLKLFFIWGIPGIIIGHFLFNLFDLKDGSIFIRKE